MCVREELTLNFFGYEKCTLGNCVPSAGAQSRIDERFQKSGILDVDSRCGDGRGWAHHIVKGGVGSRSILGLVVAKSWRGYNAGEKAIDRTLDALHPVRHAVGSAAGMASGQVVVADRMGKPGERVGCCGPGDVSTGRAGRTAGCSTLHFSRGGGHAPPAMVLGGTMSLAH